MTTDPATQIARLVDLGVHGLAGLSAAAFTELAPPAPHDAAVLVISPSLVPAADLVPLLRHRDRPGFVVTDLSDLAEFTDIDPGPRAPLYWLSDVQRGDEMANWSPDEALPAIRERVRVPLTVSEGISWLLQQPERLERGKCFMTIGSRKATPKGLDTRTPAIWISNGTGRDGSTNKHAPKIGWCWAGNRHTWLGFASAAARLA